MSKPEETIKVIKTATTKTLSGKSTLTYRLGTKDDNSIHVRISKNTGGGFFSDEWISMNDVRSVLDEQPEGTRVTSFMLQPLFKGKSVNTPAFLLAALANEKLLYPMKGKKRGLEVVDSDEFTEKVTKLMSSKAAVRKTTNAAKKKVTTKKVTAKKKSTARKKTV